MRLSWIQTRCCTMMVQVLSTPSLSGSLRGNARNELARFHLSPETGCGATFSAGKSDAVGINKPWIVTLELGERRPPTCALMRAARHHSYSSGPTTLHLLTRSVPSARVLKLTLLGKHLFGSSLHSVLNIFVTIRLCYS